MVDFQSKMETQLMELWQALLHIVPNRDSHFFAIGGNSLLLIRLSILIQEKLHIKVDIGKLLQNPVLKDMAEVLVQSANKESMNNEKSFEINDTVELSSYQQQLWQTHLSYGVSSHHWHNMPFFFKVTGNLDVSKFESSLQTVIQNNPILSVSVQLGRPPRLKMNGHKLQIQKYDLTGETPQSQKSFLTQLETKEYHRLINPLSDPLCYMCLIITAPNECYFMLNVHHLIFDGVSLNIFIQQLLDCYEDSRLFKHPANYLDYNRWEENNDLMNYYQEGLAYWEKQLEKKCDTHNELLDTQSADDNSHAVQSITLSTQQLKLLKDVATKNGVSLFSVISVSLMTALDELKHDIGDTTFAMYTANRTNFDFHNAIGLFVNLCLIKFTRQPSIQEQILDNHRIISEALNYQDVPFGVVAKYLNQPQTIRSHVAVSVVFHENVLNFEVITDNLQLNLVNFDTSPKAFAIDTDIKITISVSSDGVGIYITYRKPEKYARIVSTLLDKIQEAVVCCT